MAAIVYDEITIQNVQVESFSITPVLDEEERIVQFHRFHMVAHGWLLGENNAGTNTVEDKKEGLFNVMARLARPRRQFSWYERSAPGGSPILIIQPGLGAGLPTRPGSGANRQSLTALGQDVLYGPIVQASIIGNYNAILHIRFEILASLNASIQIGLGSGLRENTSTNLPIISHTSSVTYTIDQNHYTNRLAQGTIMYRADIGQNWDSDKYRADVFASAALQAAFPGWDTSSDFTKGVPLPPGFLRKYQQYSMGAKRNILHYIVVDQEVYEVPPHPATAIDAQMEITAIGFSVDAFEKTLTGTVEGNALTTKAELTTVILQLLQRHIQTTDLVFVDSATIIDFLYDNRIAFRFHAYQAPGLFFSSYGQAGVFINPPSDRHHFYAGIRGTAGLHGSGYNLGGGESKEAPPNISVSTTGSNTAGKKDELSEAMVKDYRGQEAPTIYKMKTGLIDFRENLTVKYTKDVNLVKMAKVNLDGTVAETLTRWSAYGTSMVSILVSGAACRILSSTDKGVTPNPVAFWKDDPVTEKAMLDALKDGTWLAKAEAGTLPICGTVIVHNHNSKNEEESKLGLKLLNKSDWSYIVLLHPALVKALEARFHSAQWQQILIGLGQAASPSGFNTKLRELMIQPPDKPTP